MKPPSTFSRIVRLTCWLAASCIAVRIYNGDIGMFHGVIQILAVFAGSMFLRAFGGDSSRSASNVTYTYASNHAQSFNSVEHDWDDDSTDRPQINPATGYIMVGAFDTAGNSYGFSSSSFDNDLACILHKEGEHCRKHWIQ